MRLFAVSLASVSVGFLAGAAWLWLKDTYQTLSEDAHDVWYAEADDRVSFEEYDRVLERNNEQGFLLYAIDLKREEYAAKNHTIYRKVARELDGILFPTVGPPLNEAHHNEEE